MLQGLKSGLLGFMEWFTRLAYINILWIGFTLLGIILFGFAPATVAMFSVTRQWIKGNLNSSVFKTFWNIYRREFIKSNLSALILAIIGYVLYADIFVFNLSKSMPVFQLLIYLIGLFYLMVITYFFSVYAHFDLKWYQYVKMAILMAFAAPLKAIAMLGIGYGFFYFMAKMPAVMLFFLGSGVSYLWLMITLPTFEKLGKRRRGKQKGEGR